MNEVEQLQGEVARLRRELHQVRKEHAARTAWLERENARLTGRLNLLLAQRWRPSSEGRGDAQLSLFNEAEAEPEVEVE